MSRDVNDFAFKIATVNGIGLGERQRAAHAGHLPHGRPGHARKNIFPSNIQGLPTWYEVRVSEAGYTARRGGVDLMVAMNPQTYDKDVAEVEPGRLPALRLDLAAAAVEASRADITVLGVPLAEMCNDALHATRASAC